MIPARTREIDPALSLSELACLLLALFGPAAALYWARPLCGVIARAHGLLLAWGVVS